MKDEILEIRASQPGKVSAFYNYGAMCVAIPGWVLGTLAGAISGNLLPDFMMSALSVAIYGMFLAIIIPPAKQNKAVLAVVVAAMLISTLFKVIPFLSEVSSGFVIIITTLIVAGAAAFFCPIGDEKEEVDKLVEEYRRSLVRYRYQERLVEEKLKTDIRESDKLNYYEENQKKFILDKGLIKGLFLKIPVDAPGLTDVKKWYKSTDVASLEKIEKYSVENATIYEYFYDKWVDIEEVMVSIPIHVSSPSAFQ